MKLLEKWKIDLNIAMWESYRRAILSLLEPNSQANLLDLGSGEGYFTQRMAHAMGTITYTGSDLGYKTKITGFKAVDLNSPLPWEDRSFDVVVASHVIEHLNATDLFTREIHRILRDSGYAIISTPNLASWHNIFYLALGRQPRTSEVSDEMYPWVEAPGHRRVFTATELIKFLRFHKFEVERVVGSSYHPLPSSLAKIACKLDWKHSSVITVKVRKI